ncbi:MAG: PQQ-dependent sugar dehydrogenase [Gammaproteobacteria bacterium]|nr:PQQ-dependent sugar dehydrogenase [Gammaproteobacteria bacterium]
MASRVRFFLLSLILQFSCPVGAVNLQLTQVSELGAVVDIKHAGDGSQRLFLLQQNGVIRILDNGQLLAEPFVDISNQVSFGGEQGLLSMAFSPQFNSNNRVYLYYTDSNGDSVLSRLTASGNRLDSDSEEILLTISQPFGNHNGGRLEFGPDGMLYLGTGDGGGGGDPQNNSQNRQSLLGKLLRLDVDSQSTGFSIPADNPFFNSPDTRSEIWALGLRNPWRMAFDRLTGDLYIADVGQTLFEEVHFQPASSTGGENYGWNIMEASSCFNSTTCNTNGLTLPIAEYDHNNGDCSITGGQVYRGTAYPDLVGRYIYGDFCTGRIWSVHNEQNNWQVEVLQESGSGMFTFGEDQAGNMYLSNSNGVFLISDGPAATLNPLINFNGSMSGSYTVDGLPDQGIILTVGQNEQGLFVFVAWFTYDNSGQPLWLVGNDSIANNTSSVTLNMQRLEGPGFLNFSTAPANRTDIGSMTFTGVDCNTIQTSFDLAGLGSDNLVFKRLTNVEGRDCQ